MKITLFSFTWRERRVATVCPGVQVSGALDSIVGHGFQGTGFTADDFRAAATDHVAIPVIATGTLRGPGFLDHHESIFHMDDFSVFVCNHFHFSRIGCDDVAIRLR